MTDEDGNSKSTNKKPTGAWPFPSGMGRENDSASSDDPEAEDSAGAHEGNIVFDKNTGHVTHKDQPDFIYLPTSDVSIEITLCACQIYSNDGRYHVFGNGNVDHDSDLVGFIGSDQFVSNEIMVTIYPESTLEHHFPEPRDWKSESRSRLLFSPPTEADIGYSGSHASWTAIAYVADEGFAHLVEAAKGQFLNGVTVTLTLSKNIYRRRWAERTKGIADSVSRTFRDESNVLLYLCPSPKWSYMTDDATGSSASISLKESTINFQNKTDDTTESEGALVNELEVLRVRTRLLETNLRWIVILGVICIVASAIFR
jgi:hypothetical protein